MNDLRGFLFLMLCGIPVIASENLECRTHFICINSTHFHICGDFGDGKLRAIESVVFSCPPRLVCDEASINECHYPVVTTTTQVTTVDVYEKIGLTDFFNVTTETSTQGSEHVNSVKEGGVTNSNSTTAYLKSTTDSNKFYDHAINTPEVGTIKETLLQSDKIKDVSITVNELNNSETTQQTPGNKISTKDLQNITIEISTETSYFAYNHLKTTNGPTQEIIYADSTMTTEGSQRAGKVSTTRLLEVTTEGSTQPDKQNNKSLPEVTNDESTGADNLNTTLLPDVTTEGSARADNVSTTSLPKFTTETGTQADNISTTHFPNVTTGGSAPADIRSTVFTNETNEGSKRAYNISITFLPQVTEGGATTSPDVTTEGSTSADNITIASSPNVTTEGSVHVDNSSIIYLSNLLTESTRAKNIGRSLSAVITDQGARPDSVITASLAEVTTEGSARADNLSTTSLPELTTEGRTRRDNVSSTILPEVTTKVSARAYNVSTTSLPEFTNEGGTQADNISATALPELKAEGSKRADIDRRTPLSEVTPEESTLLNDVSTTPLPEVTIEDSTRAENDNTILLPEVITKGTTQAETVSTPSLPAVTSEASNQADKITSMLLPEVRTEGSIRVYNVITTALPELTIEESTQADNVNTTPLPEMTTEESTRADKVTTAFLPEMTTEESTRADKVTTALLPEVRTEGSTGVDNVHKIILLVLTTEGSTRADTDSVIFSLETTTEAPFTSSAESIRNDIISTTDLPTGAAVSTKFNSMKTLPISTTERADNISTTALPTVSTLSTNLDAENITHNNTTEGNIREDILSIVLPIVAIVHTKLDPINSKNVFINVTNDSVNIEVRETTERSTLVVTKLDSDSTEGVSKAKESIPSDTRSTKTLRILTTDALTDTSSNTTSQNLTFVKKNVTELTSTYTTKDIANHTVNEIHNVFVGIGGVETNQFNDLDNNKAAMKNVPASSPFLNSNKPRTEDIPSQVEIDLTGNETEIFEPLMTDIFNVSVFVSHQNNILLTNTSVEKNMNFDRKNKIGMISKEPNSMELHNNKVKTGPDIHYNKFSSSRDNDSTKQLELGLGDHYTSKDAKDINSLKKISFTKQSTKTENATLIDFRVEDSSIDEYSNIKQKEININTTFSNITTVNTKNIHSMNANDTDAAPIEVRKQKNLQTIKDGLTAITSLNSTLNLNITKINIVTKETKDNQLVYNKVIVTPENNITIIKESRVTSKTLDNIRTTQRIEIHNTTEDIYNTQTTEILLNTSTSNENYTQTINVENEMNTDKINNNYTVPQYINVENYHAKIFHPAHYMEIQQTTSLPSIIKTSTLKDLLEVKTTKKTVEIINSTRLLPTYKLNSINPHHNISIPSSLLNQHVLSQMQGQKPQDENIESNLENLKENNVLNNTKNESKFLNMIEKNKLTNVSIGQTTNSYISNITSATNYFKSIRSTVLNISDELPKELGLEYTNEQYIRQENITTNTENPKINTKVTKTKIDTKTNSSSEESNAANKFIKQSTTREVTFLCVTEGRFRAVTDQFYYICVKNNKGFIRFKLSCQIGYYVDKSTVKCESTDKNSKQDTSSSFPRAVSTLTKKEPTTEMLINTQTSRLPVSVTPETVEITHKPIITVKSKTTVEASNLNVKTFLTAPEITDTYTAKLEANTKVPMIIERNTEPTTIRPVQKQQETENIEIFQDNLNKEVKHDMPIIADIETIQSSTVSTTSRVFVKNEFNVLGTATSTKSVYIDAVTFGPKSTTTNPLAKITKTNKPMAVIEKFKKEIEILFKCPSKKPGKYAERTDCRTFYICTGTDDPVIKVCPVGTVFSDFIKQCTKNLSHCIRNNEFECSAEGRYRDVFTDIYYYICVKNRSNFIRYKLGCQNSYHVNETTLKCVRNQLNSEQSSVFQTTSTGSSEQSTAEKERIETSTAKHRAKRRDAAFKCVEEGSFPDPDNCRKYYVCSKRKDRLRKKRKRCKRHEVFHKSQRRCVSAESYECED